MTWAYPKVRRDEDLVEHLHGYRVADPYRWLEDPDSEETKAFVNAQNALTSKYLESYPYKEKFHKSLTKMFDYEKYGCPWKYGDNYYHFHNSGLQAQNVLYQLKGSLDASREEFFNPNTLEADGTAALNIYSFSKDGNYFSYGISKSGSDWVTVYVRKTINDEEGKKPLPDVIEWVKFSSLSWTVDEKGFFYNRFPEPRKTGDKGTETDSNKDSMLYYHRLGTSQSEDILVYKDPENPEYIFTGLTTMDGQFVIIDVTKDCEPVNKIYLIDLKKTNYQIIENHDFIKIVDNFDAEYFYLANDDSTFYFKTNANAPRYKIVKYDLTNSEQGFVDVIKEHPSDVLSDANVIADTKLVLTYMHDVCDRMYIHELSTGKFIKELPLEIGCIESFMGRREDQEFFFKFVSFLNPGIIYRYDFSKDLLTEYNKTKVNGLNSDKMETKQVFVESKDKTKIPIFIIKPKDINFDGNNPTFLYGYGGFNVCISPMFSTSWLSFVQHFNGVVVVSNLRGGGEYGEEWHRAGRFANKQNVFDDFQAVAKWLIDNNITRSGKLAINGGSNGGLLVGACINQAPELFGAAVADVGVMDMLRFHKFTIGHAWKSDYGDPDKKEDFEYIYKYSPLHNVQTKKPYPAVLLTTSDHDDRVVPLHSYKYISQLQYAAKNNPHPLIIRIDTKAGHGAGKPTQKKIDEAIDKFSFIVMSIDAEWRD
ncbi:prolyl endopeptidase [Glomus cerebriforme]|uniref:Prolyl endopeptidase n=1 Tax=Glomus cerebriforme TaxID=658196 RepID=A0A397STZ8_9GLOM|nr:prolyl endopeptidase [Glomus cerebriforme]RIA87437.1 prolyl endopeptidase [Glomus cerebriforme]